jgi:hypothetical protein
MTSDRPTLTPPEWATLRAIARAGKLPVGVGLVKRVQGGKGRITEDCAIAIHQATAGVLPVWKIRPDLWAPGMLPPALAGQQ